MDKQQRVREAAATGTCPQCGSHIAPGSGTGSGRIDDGLFCDVGCYGTFYEVEIRERDRQSGLGPHQAN